MIIRSHDSMSMQNYKKKGNQQRFLKKNFIPRRHWKKIKGIHKKNNEDQLAQFPNRATVSPQSRNRQSPIA